MKVAIVGAGAAGLCCARHLSKLPKKFKFQVYEQSHRLGGTWVYSDNVSRDTHSSMYKNLRVNFPKQLMEFPGFPFRSDLPSFPYHWDVLQYLEQYALHYDLKRFIQFGNRVERLSLLHTSKSGDQARNRSGFEEGAGWRLTSRNLLTGKKTSENFNVVLICNGHFTIPHYPKVEGMKHFTGKILHSHLYREPSSFGGQTVLIVGAGQSGTDIMYDVAPAAQTVFLSNRGESLRCELPENIKCIPEVEKIDRDGGVCFKNGYKKHFDTILFCTGYKYQFPFFGEDSGIKVKPGRVCTLYKHTFNCAHPSMALIGINVRVVPFPLFDLQARWIISVWSGEKFLPSEVEMNRDAEEWYQKRLRDGLPPHLAAHLLGGELQFDFYDELADLGGSERIPLVKKKMYMVWSDMRDEDLQFYKDTEYQLLNDTEFTFVRS